MEQTMSIGTSGGLRMGGGQESRQDEDNTATVCGILRQRFGDRFTTGESVRSQHCHTTTLISPQLPDGVVFPHSVEEVADVVSTCSKFRVPVIPFGTGTSLEGQVNAPSGGISVNLLTMDQVLRVNEEDLDCIVQPGITRKALNESIRDTGLFFAIDPGADASLGGMASTRASGTNAVRYGTMRDNVIALQAVMPNGEVIRTAQRARKTSAGYDLTRLLIGAEGTLGIITELTLRLHGIPESIASASCSFSNIFNACAAVIDTIQFGIPVARIELLDELTVKAVNSHSGLTLPESPLLLLEFHGTAASVSEQSAACGEIMRDHDGSEFRWTVKPEERSKLWQARHDAYWASFELRRGAKGIATDVCVPISRLAECVSAAQEKAKSMGLIAPIVGHAGDGNFHMLPLIDPDDPEEVAAVCSFVEWLAERAVDMDGTCTGEHGIGQGKMKYLERELGAAVGWMTAVKNAIDPLNIMNPGKIIPPA